MNSLLSKTPKKGNRKKSLLIAIFTLTFTIIVGVGGFIESIDHIINFDPCKWKATCMFCREDVIVTNDDEIKDCETNTTVEIPTVCFVEQPKIIIKKKARLIKSSKKISPVLKVDVNKVDTIKSGNLVVNNSDSTIEENGRVFIFPISDEVNPTLQRIKNNLAYGNDSVVCIAFNNLVRYIKATRDIFQFSIFEKYAIDKRHLAKNKPYKKILDPKVRKAIRYLNRKTEGYDRNYALAKLDLLEEDDFLVDIIDSSNTVNQSGKK